MLLYVIRMYMYNITAFLRMCADDSTLNECDCARVWRNCAARSALVVALIFAHFTYCFNSTLRKGLDGVLFEGTLYWYTLYMSHCYSRFFGIFAHSYPTPTATVFKPFNWYTRMLIFETLNSCTLVAKMFEITLSFLKNRKLLIDRSLGRKKLFQL